MNITDFIIGGLLANSISHFILGITKTRYLCLFGYSSVGNIAYAVLQFIISITIFHFKYGISSILENGFFVGGLTVLILFFLFGNLLLKIFNKKSDSH